MSNGAKLFISYRRKDWAFTHRLVNELRDHLNAEIFIDFTGIDAADFEGSILSHLRNADGVLLVVSPLTFDPNRIQQSDDWVHREIALALQLNKPTLLACIDAMKPPSPLALPPDIRDITRMQGVDFYADYWDAGIQRLLDFITRIIPSVTIKLPPDPSLPAATAHAAPVPPAIPLHIPPLGGGRARWRTTIVVILFALLVALVGGGLLGSLNLSTGQVAPTPTRTVPPVTLAPSVVPSAHVVLPSSTPIPTITDNKQWTPFIQNRNGVSMALVPPGCFKMGSDSNVDKNAQPEEQPPFQLCFSQSFWIDIYDVTNSDYQKFTNAGGYKQQGTWWTDTGWAWYKSAGNPHPVSEPGFTDVNQPRVGITWFEAYAFCKWRGAQLPTEAEWEYAARGPSDPIYPWGVQSQDVFDPAKVVSSASSTIGRSAPVGTKPTGASWVGALDMIGNVWQWTSSIYAKTAYGPTYRSDDYENPADTNNLRVLRGGAWFSSNVMNLRSAYRNRFEPTSQSTDVGVRCVQNF